MKKRNSQAIQVIMIGLMAILVIAVIGFGIVYFTGGVPQTAVGKGVEEAVKQTQEGDVAQIKVFVRDMSNDDVNTKIAVPVYCQDGDGSFIIDATSSSTTAEISGSTTRDQTYTCWAFNSTIQTYVPATGDVDKEIVHVVIDAYSVSTSATIDFYDDTFTVADNGASNITLTSEGSDTFQKLKFTSTGTDDFLPLGGFYVNEIEVSNVSRLDITGSATVSSRAVTDAKGATSIVNSDLTTKVSARKSSFDYVFEIDDGNAVLGNNGLQPILLDENDFIESGTIVVESEEPAGCTGDTNVLSFYTFSKGFYRSAKDNTVNYGHENDAVSASVISADIHLDNFTCAQA